jgi:hypothetical protein
MSMRLILIILLSLPAAVLAQTAETEPATSVPPPAGMTMTHEVVAGGQLGPDNDISSKFNEYRDLGQGFRIFNLRLLGNTDSTARFLEATGTNLGGDDQFFGVRAGRYGTWSAVLDYDAMPHRLTNDALLVRR